MREAYRLNKLELLDEVESGSVKLRILLSLSNKAYAEYDKIEFAEVSRDMIEILQVIKNEYSKTGKVISGNK